MQLYTPVYRITRGRVHTVNEEYINQLCSRVVASISAIFNGTKGDDSYEDVFRITRQLCLYQRAESLFQQVTEHLNHFIAIRVNQLGEQLSMENPDILTVMDTFWTSLYGIIRTLSFILVYLSQSCKSRNLTVYCAQVVRSLLLQQEASIGTITKLYAAIINNLKSVRESQLNTIYDSNEMETEVEFDITLQRKISNLVAMCDFLEYYSDLQKQYFLSVRKLVIRIPKIEAFYRIFAFDLLRKVDISRFISAVTKIIQIEESILEKFFDNRGKPLILKEVLIGCCKLYANEILDKGLQELVDLSSFQKLSLLYRYYQMIDELDLLKASLCRLIVNKRDTIFGDMSMTEIVAFYNQMKTISGSCCERNPAISMEIQSTWVQLINQHAERFSEKLVQYIDKVIRDYHDNETPIPGNFVETVIMMLLMVSQKNLFESLYRELLFSHVIDYRDQLLPQETQIIDEIKAICGNVFITRLDTLAKDALNSQSIRKEFDTVVSKVPRFHDSTFHVLSKDDAHKVPAFPNTPIPPRILELQKEFDRMYHNKYNSRILMYIYEESQYSIDYKGVELHVDFPQMTVLDLFNRGDSYSIQEMMQLTHLPENVIKTAVNQLTAVSSGPILVMNSETDRISVNETPTFASPKLQLYSRLRLEAPSQSISSNVVEDKTSQLLQLQAAIVRVLKKEQFIQLSNLPAKLNEVLSFRPDEEMIQQAIDVLLNKEIIARDEKDVSILKYVVN